MVVGSFIQKATRLLWVWLNIINDCPSQYATFLLQRHDKTLVIGEDQNIVMDVLDHTLQFNQEGRVSKVLLADTWYMSCLLFAC